MWYEKPAQKWDEALPIGNGRLGAMIFGGTEGERIALNDDSVWSGGIRNRINPDAREKLPEVRRLLREDRPQEAEELMRLAFSGMPCEERVYQPLADLLIRYALPVEETVKADTEQNLQPSGYRRELDLEHGLVREHWCSNAVAVSKEYLVSYPDEALLMHMKVEQGSLSGSMTLSRDVYADTLVQEQLEETLPALFLQGQAGTDGVRYCCGAALLPIQGAVSAQGGHLLFSDCREWLLIVSSGSSFYDGAEENAVIAACRKRLTEAAQRGYEACRKRHVSDYCSLADRMQIVLKGADHTDLPMEERLRRYRAGEEDQMLEAEFFQFGRHLMISGSRAGSQPLNLQGIWNDRFNPPWGSKYTININLEMNYWMADCCNLSDCYSPFFALLERASVHGEETARKMYGCRGMVFHHNLDIWGDAAPQDEYLPATYWVMGSAWLCTHLWEHYLYTGDTDWMRKTAFPLLQDAVEFYLDFMIMEDGYAVISPSLSPENTYLDEKGEKAHACTDAAMDAQLLRDLFTAFLKAAKILYAEQNQLSQEMRERVRQDCEQVSKWIEKLPPIRIGRDGRICEWNRQRREAEPGHRHISHLYALYPSHQINPETTPDLARAAERSLDQRVANGSGYTGWSCAWILCAYARLGRLEKAHACLRRLICESTCPNLMDSHPGKQGSIFQIDGNLGACAGMAEMFYRIAETGTVPEAWKEGGQVQGLCDPQRADIEVHWEKQKQADK